VLPRNSLRELLDMQHRHCCWEESLKRNIELTAVPDLWHVLQMQNAYLSLASPADTEELAAFAARTFTDTFGHRYAKGDLEFHLRKTCSARFFAEALAVGASIYLARVRSELVGYVKAGAVELPVEHDSGDREIHRLYVLQRYMGHGMATQLMEAALASPALVHAPRLYLGVWEENQRLRQRNRYEWSERDSIGRFIQ
jgi:GNAT superfamily N-acetyltransferase